MDNNFPVDPFMWKYVSLSDAVISSFPLYPFSHIRRHYQNFPSSGTTYGSRKFIPRSEQQCQIQPGTISRLLIFR